MDQQVISVARSLFFPYLERHRKWQVGALAEAVPPLPASNSIGVNYGVEERKHREGS